MDTIDARPPEEEQVRVIMTREQANALIAVLACVGGDPVRSRRGLVQPIFEALRGLKGVAFCTDDLEGPNPCISFLSEKV